MLWQAANGMQFDWASENHKNIRSSWDLMSERQIWNTDEAVNKKLTNKYLLPLDVYQHTFHLKTLPSFLTMDIFFVGVMSFQIQRYTVLLNELL